MLAAFDNAPLFKSPDKKRGGYYAFLEAWKISGDTEANNDNSTIRRLEEVDIADWARQQGAYSRAHGNSTSNRKSEGGFRILFAEPETSFRESIPEALITSDVLKALNLPGCSFASFQMSSGVFSLHTVPEGSTIDTCARLGLVFRTPQKSECSTGGISVCHDFSTGVTTALIVGYSFSLEEFKSTPPETLKTFLRQLRENWVLWSHPLLLPSTFLILHTLQVRLHIYKSLSHKVMSLERCIGVTKAGRPVEIQQDASEDHDADYNDTLFGQDENGEQYMQRDIAKKLTASINDLSTSILFTKRSPKWDMECSRFLTGLMTKSKRLQAHGSIPGQQFEQTLEYVYSYSEALAEATETFQARLRLQLNILYTAVAQDDGQTSARLAASAGKDSTSMKILALITAAYLPGTFVSSFFSMGMFEWSDGPYGTVSESFWVYWAVAVPLTLLTLIFWGIWWKFELNRFERNVQKAKAQQDAAGRQALETMSKQKDSDQV